MAYWLVKEEPTHYNFADFLRDRTTEWTGVHNALALRYLRSMVPRDEGFYYHSGAERAIVGRFVVADRPRPDPEDPRGSWKVTLRAGGALPRPVPLAEVKSVPALAEFELVRFSRLSVMPVPAAVWSRVLKMARG